MNTHRRSITLFFIAFLLIIPFIFSGIGTKAVVKKVPVKIVKPVKKNKAINKNTFTIIISNGIKGCLGIKGTVILKKNIEINSKKDALTYLKENSEVIENGGFIKYINGLKSVYPIPTSKMTSEQKAKGVLGSDWFIYLNNKKTLTGAGQIYPKKGDVIMFDYHYWNKDEYNASSK